jgi:hypothetical protein
MDSKEDTPDHIAQNIATYDSIAEHYKVTATPDLRAMGFARTQPILPAQRKSPGPRSGALHFAETLSSRLFRLADRDLQRADAIDAALDLVAGVELGDAGGRARHDDVAGGEFYLLR